MSKEGRKNNSFFRRCVRGMDFVSRQLLGIAEFDASEECLLRIGSLHLDREIALADGVILRRGDRALEVHLWNEHLAILKGSGTLRWANTARRRFEYSFARLAAYIEQKPELGDVRALMMKPAFTRRQRRRNLQRLPRLIRGAWTAVPRRLNAIERVHAVIDDAWLWLLSRAFNPFDAPKLGFLRHRQEFWISREGFLARFGGGGAARPRREAVTALPPRT